MPHKFLTEEEVIKVLFWAGSGFTVLFTNLDLILKALIGLATLVYLILKISKELKERKKDKNEDI